MNDIVTAGRRIARRYAELREGHPLSEKVVDLLTTVPEGWLVPALETLTLPPDHPPPSPGSRLSTGRPCTS
ncbi:hypothetical protein [Sphaerisporangium sp. TRM90804]|uniref:hypothetical protein n=1 Tax=Sphaerisporangium sp. TRM90804 TaxID=3031113 RepID=UPI002448ED1A|nr:hypothetical protein [Sphaerisporangium sp. TRM90804]MDH2424491.1 hypothetical protein [Sphaerisporangium sp. TRM90804]